MACKGPGPAGAWMADEAARSPADRARLPRKPCLTLMPVISGHKSLPPLPPSPLLSSSLCSMHSPEKSRTSGAGGRGTFGISLGQGGCQKTAFLLAVRRGGGGWHSKGGRTQCRTSSPRQTSNGAEEEKAGASGLAVGSVLRYWGRMEGPEKRKKKKNNLHNSANSRQLAYRGVR